MSPRQVSSGPFFVTTAPMATTCYTCRQLVLAATVGGFDIHVDVDAITDEGELTALLARRRTYELHGDRLVYRTALHMTSVNVGMPLLAEHACGQPIDDRHVDHVWDEVAAALVAVLLGAVPVLPEHPPF